MVQLSMMIESHSVQFFADKDKKFYERGIMKLPEKWQKVIEQNRKYYCGQKPLCFLND